MAGCTFIYHSYLAGKSPSVVDFAMPNYPLMNLVAGTLYTVHVRVQDYCICTCTCIYTDLVYKEVQAFRCVLGLECFLVGCAKHVHVHVALWMEG